MNFKALIAAATLAAAAVSPALAQSVIGRALVDGKMVEILNNNTWRYEGQGGGSGGALGIGPSETAGKQGCKDIHPNVTFCADPAMWENSPPASPDINAAYRHDDRHYGQFIIEGFGGQDGVTHELMRQIVIQNAAGATGQNVTDIPTLSVDPAMIGGEDAETVVYRVNFSGLDVVFANTIVIQPSLTMQAITYAIGSEYSQAHQDLHKVLLENTTMK